MHKLHCFDQNQLAHCQVQVVGSINLPSVNLKNRTIFPWNDMKNKYVQVTAIPNIGNIIGYSFFRQP